MPLMYIKNPDDPNGKAIPWDGRVVQDSTGSQPGAAKGLALGSSSIQVVETQSSFDITVVRIGDISDPVSAILKIATGRGTGIYIDEIDIPVNFAANEGGVKDFAISVKNQSSVYPKGEYNIILQGSFVLSPALAIVTVNPVVSEIQSILELNVQPIIVSDFANSATIKVDRLYNSLGALHAVITWPNSKYTSAGSVALGWADGEPGEKTVIVPITYPNGFEGLESLGIVITGDIDNSKPNTVSVIIVEEDPANVQTTLSISDFTITTVLGSLVAGVDINADGPNAIAGYVIDFIDQPAPVSLTDPRIKTSITEFAVPISGSYSVNAWAIDVASIISQPVAKTFTAVAFTPPQAYSLSAIAPINTIDSDETLVLNLAALSTAGTFPINPSATSLETNGLLYGSAVISNGILTYTPNGLNGDINDSLTYRIYDTDGNSAVGAVILRINNLANFPVVISGNPQTSVSANSKYLFQPTAHSDFITESGGDDLDSADSGVLLHSYGITFTISNKPSWAVFDTATGELSGTPGIADVGSTNNIIITADNGLGEANSTQAFPSFGIAVTASNTAPTLTNLPRAVYFVGEILNHQLAGFDAESSNLTYSAINLPAGLTLNTQTGLITGTLTQVNVGIFANVIFSVNDGSGASNSVVSTPAMIIEIKPPVTPVNFSGAPIGTSDIGAVFSFTPTLINPDNLTYTLTVTNLPSWASFDTTTGRIFGTPTNNSSINSGGHVGTYDITLSWADSENNTDNLVIQITVVDVAQTVAINIDQAPLTLQEGGSTQLTATVTGLTNTSVTWELVDSNGVSQGASYAGLWANQTNGFVGMWQNRPVGITQGFIRAVSAENTSFVSPPLTITMEDAAATGETLEVINGYAPKKSSRFVVELSNATESNLDSFVYQNANLYLDNPAFEQVQNHFTNYVVEGSHTIKCRFVDNRIITDFEVWKRGDVLNTTTGNVDRAVTATLAADNRSISFVWSGSDKFVVLLNETQQATFTHWTNKQISVEQQGNAGGSASILKDVYKHPLFIFGNPTELPADIYNANDADVLYFGPGLTIIDEGFVFNTKKKVYFHRDAYVQINPVGTYTTGKGGDGGTYSSGLFIHPGDNSQITVRGLGVMSGELFTINISKWSLHTFHVKGNAGGFDISGVTMSGMPRAFLDGQQPCVARNCKYMAWWRGADGLQSGSNSVYDDLFMKCNDDVVKLYTNNVSATNLLIWHQNHGACCQLSWQNKSNVINGLYENVTIVADDAVFDTQVINGNNSFGATQIPYETDLPATRSSRGVIGASMGMSGKTVSNVVMRNIQMLASKPLRLFAYRLYSSSFVLGGAGTQSNQNAVVNLTMENVFVRENSYKPNTIYANVGGSIEITFTNFYIGNTKVLSGADFTPKLWNTGYFEVGNTNITFN